MSQQRKTLSIPYTWGEVANHSQSGAGLMRTFWSLSTCHTGWVIGGKSQGTISPSSAWGFTSVAPINTNGCSPYTNCPLPDGGTDP